MIIRYYGVLILMPIIPYGKMLSMNGNIIKETMKELGKVCLKVSIVIDTFTNYNHFTNSMS